jgi:hypothetical protein
MTASTETKRAEELSPARTAAALLRHYLGGQRGLMLLTVIALGTGLALNWSWLVAAGVAPLLLALAPCSAMCALDLCMNKMASKPGSGPEKSALPGVTSVPEATAAPMANEEARKVT